MEYNEENNINKFHQSQDENQQENQELDIKDIHGIMHDSYEFHFPNREHEPSI